MEMNIRFWGLLYLLFGMTTVAFGQGHSLTGEVESERTGLGTPTVYAGRFLNPQRSPIAVRIDGGSNL